MINCHRHCVIVYYFYTLQNRKQPSCNPGYHIKVDAPVELSVLAMKLGRSIKFDPDTEQIVGDEEAARMAIPEYRAPWKFPSEYLLAGNG